MAQAGREGNSAKTRNVRLRKRKLCNEWVPAQFDEPVSTDAALLGRVLRKKHCRKLMAVKAPLRFRSQCRSGSRVRHREANDERLRRQVQPPGSSASPSHRIRNWLCRHPNPGSTCMTTGDPRVFMWAEACAL